MKKILALVLTLTMVLGTFTFVAAAPEDVVGTDCEDAVARLMALGIISGFPDGTYKPDEPVTRAQFAKIIVSALGVGEAANYAAGATKFADVPADHWATGYINVAVDVGVINGYPDGTFLPENQVTFAEAIKMIVAALGYTPKAEAMGGYPGGYLAVAAEEEITDGVNVVGTLSANRGAVAMMVDNALDVYLMEQVSYGDSPRWEASDTKTLLNTKLGVKEVKGVVTNISRTAKLDEEEFELDNDEVYEMVIDVNTESLFLKEVKILHKDEKVVWVSVETAEKDILFDTVEEIILDEENGTTVTGFKLKVADKDYELLAGADIFVNYEEDDAAVGDYGYFIFDGKEIAAACLFSFDEKGFVTAVEEDEIEYIELEEAEEQALELDDYDEVYVYNKDFTAAELDDVDENSVIFYWDNDDELFVMVVNEAVEGEVTRLREDRVTIDGKNYVRGKVGDDPIAAVISLNKGKDFDKWAYEKVSDVMDEEVVLYLDLNGNIAALVTSAKATSDSLYGIVTWYYDGRSPSVEVFTSEGEEVEYFFEERADATQFAGSYDPGEGETVPNVVAIKYSLTSDGEIAEDPMKEDTIVNITKEADRKYVVSGGTTYYINSDTVIMKALDKDGDVIEIDPEVIEYDTLVDMGIESATPAIVITDTSGNTAKLIVFTDPAFEGSKDDIFFGVVVDKPWKVGSNWFAEVDVFEEGKADYKLTGPTQVAKGNLVAFKLSSSDKVDYLVKGIDNAKDTEGEALAEKAQIVQGTVYDRDGSYITLVAGGTAYKVASGAVLYKTKGDKLTDSLDGTIRVSRINVEDKIALLIDVKEKEVVAAIVAPKVKE